MDCDGHGMGYTVSRKRRRMSRFPVMQIMDLIMDPPLLLHGNYHHHHHQRLECDRMDYTLHL